MSDSAVTPAHKRPAIRPIVQVAAGNALEIYDFFAYGYYARYIGQAFFPNDNPYVSLMLALMTYGVGFLARPVGALVLGSYTDHRGRRRGLILSLALMALGMLSVACTPSYATIGVLAPIIVVAGRLLQGFSAGAELGGVVTYLAEISPPRRRAFYTCWQVTSQQCSVMALAIIGVGLFATLSPAQIAGWGWRVPLWIGCGVVPIMFWLRMSLPETAVFARRRETPSFSEVCSILLANWRTILLCMGTVAFATGTSQTIQTYGPTYFNSLNLGVMAGFVTVFFVGLTTFICLPLAALVADKVNRRSMLIVVTLVAAATAYPVLAWLSAAPSVARFAAFELWFAFVLACYSAVQVPTVVELVPARVRATAWAFSQAAVAAVVGGFTPAICTWLTHISGNNAMVGVWLGVNALIGLLAATLLDGRATRARQGAEMQ
jgi:MFS family permease